MKKLNHIALILFFVGLTQTSIAQSWVYGGNSPTTEQFIGTINDKAFPIKTLDLERMRIAANGNVGIGTNNPLNLLDINSSTASNVFQRFSNSVTGNGPNNGFRVGIDNNGGAVIAQREPLPLSFYTDNKNRVHIVADGKVGIGTQNPTHTLHVNGSLSAKQIFVESKNETQDLLVLITQLQAEVTELKQKCLCLAENDFVTSKTK